VSLPKCSAITCYCGGGEGCKNWASVVSQCRLCASFPVVTTDGLCAFCRHTHGEPDPVIRTFSTGATRDVDQDKLDFEGFLSPLVLQRYAEYMHANRVQPDGNLRDSDNWQKGIPKDAYMKSGWRHFVEWWSGHRTYTGYGPLETALCALLFNVMGYLHETLKARHYTGSPVSDKGELPT
jgi:hypothetical protein